MSSARVSRKRWFLLSAIVAIVLGLVVWQWPNREHDQSVLRLYGNIDLRQVSLAFNNSERILEVLSQEGDRVQQGQVLARLDTSRLSPRVAEAAAQAEAQKQVVERMHNGSRPEEIAQARANLDAARADADYARLQYQRLKLLSGDSSGRAVSKQDLDSSRSALSSTEARVMLNKKALDLALIGPRKEDIAQAEAQLRSYEAQLTYLRQQIKDAELSAPSNAIVRSRLLEPGEMSSPQRPIYSLALVDPKWVRAYVGEADLGLLHPGAAAQVSVDSFPERTFDGWIGFISPVAEFTPKPVQTEELRPSLSYEVRVFVKDPVDDLRLGMPATVQVPLPPFKKKSGS
ncbi:MAG TPA: efflux RND transporter periplasmic adaptor subunit [Methylobacter sp.]|jgi:HlyD family secretion protein